MNDAYVQNTAELRAYNRKKILMALLEYGAMTKREIADRVSLSFSTISTLCNQLEEERLLEYASMARSNGGRLPRLLTIHGNAGYVACINLIEADEVVISVVNLLGETLAGCAQKVLGSRQYADILNACLEGFNRLILGGNLDRSRFIAAGSS